MQFVYIYIYLQIFPYNTNQCVYTSKYTIYHTKQKMPWVLYHNSCFFWIGEIFKKILSPNISRWKKCCLDDVFSLWWNAEIPGEIPRGPQRTIFTGGKFNWPQDYTKKMTVTSPESILYCFVLTSYYIILELYTILLSPAPLPHIDLFIFEDCFLAKHWTDLWPLQLKDVFVKIRGNIGILQSSARVLC